MSYHIRYDEKEGIIEIKLSGKWTKENVDTLTCSMTDLPVPNVGRLLFDIRDIEGQLGVVDAYSSVEKLPSEQRLRKTALLDREENLKTVSFIETTAQNRGFPIRCFSVREEALKWLKS